MLEFAALCSALGASAAVGLICLCGGYIAAVAVMERFGKTVLGTHIRHFFVRIAPAKRFDETDRQIIERVLIDAIKKGRIADLIGRG
jgi:hypothetical protein